MRIAYIVHDYSRSFGHGRYVVELAERFSRDHEVHVFANTFSLSTGSNILYHHVPAWRATALTTILSFLLPATFKIGDAFDIVHTQGLCSLRFNVVTAHLCMQAWLKARAKTSGKTSGQNWRSFFYERLVCPLEKRIYDQSKGWTIAVSEKVRTELSQFYHKTERVAVIHHGVNTVQFSPDNRQRFREKIREELRIPQDEGLFLFVGDMTKGATVLMRALAKLHIGRLLILSRTPLKGYSNLAESLGIQNRVHFAQPTETIEHYYAAADAFVFPTVYDSFGMVVTEAMASGLPVITTRYSGASELIEHGKDALLLEDTDNELELSRAMESLLTDDNLRNGLANAARHKMQQYSWDQVAHKTMELYNRIVGQTVR